MLKMDGMFLLITLLFGELFAKRMNSFVLHTEDVSKKFKELNVITMVADWTDKENWVLGDFLFEIGQSSIPFIPYYPWL